MKLVERHIISKHHPCWVEIDNICFNSKNLFNLAMYYCRQKFFASGQSYNLPELYHLTKDSGAYRALPTKVSKQIIKRVVQCWVGYFNALKVFAKHPEKFLSKPKLPKYKDKTKGRFVTPYTHESVYKKSLKEGVVHLSMSDIKIPTKVQKVVEVRLVPKTNCYVVEIVHEQLEKPAKAGKSVAGVDLGLNNLVTLTSNVPDFRPVIINGRPLKAFNQLYNKRKAVLQSNLPEKKYSSVKIEALTKNRNQYVDNYLHQVSNAVVKLLLQYDISKLVIGKNDGWKQNISIGKRNNQQFVQIPHARLIDMLTYKCQMQGIEVIVTEESYTSKTSFLDMELPQKHETYQGRRVHRGLFRSAMGKLINADVNGACQIIRKVFPNAFAEGIVRCAVQPIKVCPL